MKHSTTDSPTSRVRESATHRVGESATSRLAESESQRLPDWPSRRVIFPRILSQIGTARNVVQGTNAEPIYAKTLENRPHCNVPLIFHEDFRKKLLNSTSSLSAEDFFFLSSPTNFNKYYS